MLVHTDNSPLSIPSSDVLTEPVSAQSVSVSRSPSSDALSFNEPDDLQGTLFPLYSSLNKIGMSFSVCFAFKLLGILYNSLKTN